VKWIKLKGTQTVCTEKERNRERKRGKTERKHSYFPFFPPKKINSRQKNKIKKIKKCLGTRVTGHPQGSRAGVPCHPGTRDPISGLDYTKCCIIING
jgi:hypothetical protein